MSIVMITGANRGLGLEFVRQYAEAGEQIIACCRHPEQAVELNSLAQTYKTIKTVSLDMGDDTSILQLAATLKEQVIDIFINNAGIYGDQGVRLENVDMANLQKVFHINAAAPVKLLSSLLPCFQAGRKIIAVVSSKMGSIADNASGGSYAYRASKAALNSMMKSVAIDLKAQHFTVIILHPGWVKTAMGGPNALISAAESVNGMRTVIANATPAQTGSFLDYRGQIIPW